MNAYNVVGVDTAINYLIQTFGRPYLVSTDDTRPELRAYNLETETADEYDRLSQFGTPLMGTFHIEAYTYQKYDVNNKLVDFTFDDFEFPVASIVAFSRKKNTVITPTLGGKGSVKEIMGLDDWQISIKGLIVKDESRVKYTTVKEQQKQLDIINEIAGSLRITGKIFEEREIHHIVISELKYTQIQGNPNLIQYEIEALSDEDFFI